MMKKIIKQVEKQVHRIVIESHQTVAHNETHDLVQIQHHLVVVHRMRKNLADMIKLHHPNAINDDRPHRVVQNETMIIKHDDIQDLVHLFIHQIEVIIKVLVINLK